MLYNVIKTNSLTYHHIKFCQEEVPALLETREKLSLIQNSVLQLIKDNCKVEYVSRCVRINTLNNSCIAHLSAVNIKF